MISDQKKIQKEIVDNTIDDILILLDSDNNGFIGYEEFLRACVNKKIFI